jgi:hypothetical protein
MVTVDHEPGAFWNQPRGDYLRQAMEDLGLEEDELEDPGSGAEHVFVGDYPNLDRVYARAWELQAADEAD